MLPQLTLSKVDAHTATVTPLGFQRIWHAQRFFTRLRGLLGRPRLAVDEGLLLSPCGQVHTFGMGYALDVVCLDKQGCIVKCVPGLAPNRVAGAVGARHTLELASGAIMRQGLVVGDRLTWRGVGI